MRLLFVHAHFDDFEFTAAGTFLLWPKPQTQKKVLICTDGAAGHHLLSREKTSLVRLAEQEASARIGGFKFEVLRLPDGRVPREARWECEPDFFPALWKAIRDFEPDYLFCPPLAESPLDGIHVDHVMVGEAVRKVAYLVNVPHAFSPEYPEESGPGVFKNTPVILTVQDVYSNPRQGLELIVDVSPVFDKIVEMSWCHQSQIREWLPWVGRHRILSPRDFDDWKNQMEQRYAIRARKLGLPPEMKVEAFTLTAWGTVPSFEQLIHDFPNLVFVPERMKRLKERIAEWLDREG